MLKLFTALYRQEKNLLSQFFTQSIYLLDKTNPWNLKFWPSWLLEENPANFFERNWNQELDFAETFHSPLLSGEEIALSIFCWSNFSFRRNQPIKFEILTFSPARKPLCQFFAQAIYLLDKTNQWNSKFWPFCLFKENSPNFFELNWKPGFRFCWNFS